MNHTSPPLLCHSLNRSRVFSSPQGICTCYSQPGKGFPGGASGKEPTCQCRRWKRLGFNPWVGKIPGEGHGNPLQYPCLGSPMDRKEPGGLESITLQSQTRLKQLSTHTHGHNCPPNTNYALVLTLVKPTLNSFY